MNIRHMIQLDHAQATYCVLKIYIILEFMHWNCDPQTDVILISSGYLGEVISTYSTFFFIVMIKQHK